MIYELFPPCVEQAYCLVWGDPVRSPLANLAIHQYQAAILAAQNQRHLTGLTPENLTGSQDCFTWAWANPVPSCPLETYARELYEQLKADGQSHALAHVAISALAQVSELTGGCPWDLTDTHGYHVIASKGSTHA